MKFEAQSLNMMYTYSNILGKVILSRNLLFSETVRGMDFENAWNIPLKLFQEKSW